jgi:fructosamine-3-kinase
MGLPPANLLAPWLQQQLGEDGPLELVAQRPVGGGCIHRAWQLELADGRQWFLKSNGAEALPLLLAEAEGLRALARWARLPLLVPEPLGVGLLAGQALLLLPWLVLDGASSSRGSGAGGDGWFGVGAGLAALHRASAEAGASEGRFGWSRDNVIGSSPQINGWDTNWARFFVDCRLEPQLRWAAQQGQTLRGAKQLLELVPHWLGGHQVQPALVHGDLWSGNAALLAGGGGALFDPAVYWGDREVDLAMAQLFGGFPQAFFN